MVRRAVSFAILLCLGLGDVIAAQSSRSGNQSQVHSSNRIEAAGAKAADEQTEELQKTLVELSDQVRLLTAEIRRLRRVSERNSNTTGLLLAEDRVFRLEEKLDSMVERRSQLEAQEQNLQYRLRNIQGEVLFRGGLRRDEAETAIRSEIQRGLDDVRRQQSAIQSRIADLQAQLKRFQDRAQQLLQRIEADSEDKDGIKK